MASRFNDDVAGRLEEAAQLLESQGAGPWRVRAYRRAAATVRRSPASLDELFGAGGLPARDPGSTQPTLTAPRPSWRPVLASCRQLAQF